MILSRSAYQPGAGTFRSFLFGPFNSGDVIDAIQVTTSGKPSVSPGACTVNAKMLSDVPDHSEAAFAADSFTPFCSKENTVAGVALTQNSVSGCFIGGSNAGADGSGDSATRRIPIAHQVSIDRRYLQVGIGIVSQPEGLDVQVFARPAVGNGFKTV